MKVMNASRMDKHDRRRFTELCSRVDVDSARNEEFARLPPAEQKKLLSAILKLMLSR